MSDGEATVSGWRRHAPAIAVTLMIAAALLLTAPVVVSLLSGLLGSWLPFAEEMLDAPTGPGADKLVHLVLFFVHTATLVRSFSGGGRHWMPVLVAGAISLLFGGAMEVAQGFVGRDNDPWDVVADAAGAGLCVAWNLFRRRGR